MARTVKQIAELYRLDRDKALAFVRSTTGDARCNYATTVPEDLEVKIVAALRPKVAGPSGQSAANFSVTDSMMAARANAVSPKAAASTDAVSAALEYREPQKHRVFCHNDFLFAGKADGGVLGEDDATARRATLVLQHLYAHGRTSVVKGTKGNDNKGWRRTPFGGNRGSHFYAWWAPAGAEPATPLKGPNNAIYVRCIRHHDDHTPLKPGDFSEYEEITASRIMKGDEFRPPWTEPQDLFARSQSSVRLLVGTPGTGKTTALWQAVNLRAGQRVLYLTWSKRLANLAEEHFKGFAPVGTEVECLTFDRLLARLVARPVQPKDQPVGYPAFLAAIASVSAGTLGQWKEHKLSLYGEVRAQLVGAARPDQDGQLIERDRPRLSETAYRNRRAKFLGPEAIDALLAVVSAIEKHRPIESFFPELMHAFAAGVRLSREVKTLKSELASFERIVVDEVQDLTPVEALVPVLVAEKIGQTSDHGAPFFLAAGDEGQTVRPTDFEWGWFSQMLTMRVGKPQEIKLSESLRCPERIAALVNAAGDFYSHIPKADRPRYQRDAYAVHTINDQVMVSRCDPTSADLRDLLTDLAAREGLAIVNFGDELPRYVPADLADAVLTPEQAKGCEFQHVVLLDPGQHLAAIRGEPGRMLSEAERLWKRSAIDRFRVGLSRATESLVLLDVAGGNAAHASTREFLGTVPAMDLEVPELHAHYAADALNAEDRINTGMTEALELLDTSPELSLRRARNAVALLGTPGAAGAVADPTLRREAHLCLAQVAFTLAGQRNAAAGTSSNDLLRLAAQSADSAERRDVAAFAGALRLFEASSGEQRHSALFEVLRNLATVRALDEPWIRDAIALRERNWLTALADAARDPNRCLAALEDLDARLALLIPDASHSDGGSGESWRKKLATIAAEQRATERESILRSAALALLDAERPSDAQSVLARMNPAPADLRARCLEASGKPHEAARLYEQNGNWQAAVRCLRRAGDFDGALKLAGSSEGKPDFALLAWLRDLRELAAQRPKDLERALTDHERHMLTELLRPLNKASENGRDKH